jgi:glycosyltransferase involved in cell wall biosynthesis
MHNVLFISYDGLTDPLGRSQILPYLTGLADENVRIFIVSFEKRQNFAKNEAAVRADIAGRNIEWRPQWYTKRPPILSTLYDLFRMNRAARALHREHGLSIVHCRSYLSALVGVGFRRRGARFLFDMRGFWADERIDGGVLKPSNPLHQLIYRFFKSSERRFLRQADHTVVLTAAAKEKILSWGLVRDPGTSSVIPCCVDTRLFDRARISETARAEARHRLGIAPSDEVLVYLGSLGVRYLPAEMMQFFAHLLREKPSSKFLIVTQDDPDVARHAARAAGVPLDRIAITSAVREDVPLYASLGAQGIFFIKPSFAVTGSCPTKHGEMMALGLPLVCNTGVGDTDRLVERFASGVVVHGFGETDWEQAVRDLMHAEFSTDAIVAGARAYFDLERGVATYRQIYASLLSAAPAGAPSPAAAPQGDATCA